MSTLSVSGKPHGQAALLCPKRTCFSTPRRNLAEKLGPNSVLGGAVSTTDVAKQAIPCVIKIFSPSVDFLPELDEMGYIELTVIPKFTE